MGVPIDIGNHDAPAGSTPSKCSCCKALLGSCRNYIRDTLEIIFQVRNSGKPNRDSLRIKNTTTKMRAEVWKDKLENYFDVDELVSSIFYGWDLGLDANPAPRDATHNHPSALENPLSVLDYINKELSFGCLLGPLDPSKLPYKVHRAPLATVDKPGSEFRRVITDCKDNLRGINSWIQKHWYRGENWKLSLPRLDDILDDIRSAKSEFPG